jgi:hypothetical protein
VEPAAIEAAIAGLRPPGGHFHCYENVLWLELMEFLRSCRMLRKIVAGDRNIARPLGYGALKELLGLNLATISEGRARTESVARIKEILTTVSYVKKNCGW